MSEDPGITPTDAAAAPQHVDNLNGPIDREAWLASRWSGGKPPPAPSWTRQRCENMRARSSYGTKRRNKQLVPRHRCASGRELVELFRKGQLYPYPLMQRRNRPALPVAMKYKFKHQHADALSFFVVGHLGLEKDAVICSHDELGAHLGLGARQAGTIARQLTDWGLLKIVQPTFRKACTGCKALFAAELRACPVCKAAASAKRKWRGPNVYAVTDFAARVFKLYDVARRGPDDLETVLNAHDRAATPGRSIGSGLPSREDTPVPGDTSGEHEARHPESSVAPAHAGGTQSHLAAVPAAGLSPCGRVAAAHGSATPSSLASQTRAHASSDGSLSRERTNAPLVPSSGRSAAVRPIGDALRAPAVGDHDPGCTHDRPCARCRARSDRRDADRRRLERRRRDQDVVDQRERELVIDGPKDLAAGETATAAGAGGARPRKTDDEDFADTLESAWQSFNQRRRGEGMPPTAFELLQKLRRGDS